MELTSFLTVPIDIKAHTTWKIKSKVKFEWAISNFSSFIGFRCNKHECYHLYSPDFSSNGDGNVWNMILVFNGLNSIHGSARRKWLSLSLILKKYEKNEKLKICYQFGIITCNKEIYRPYHGYSMVNLNNTILDGYVEEFCKHAELLERKSELMPNDTLRITCMVIIYDGIVSQKLSMYKPRSCDQLIQDLKNCYISKEDSDITFVVGDQELKAHKLILKHRSCVFMKMFEIDMSEKRENKVIITDARPEIFNKMLEFLYTDNIEGDLDETDARDLLNVAGKYQLERLKKICGETLCKFITTINAMEIYILVEQHDIKELLAVVKEYIQKSKVEILKFMGSEYFLKNPNLLKIMCDE